MAIFSNAFTWRIIRQNEVGVITLLSPTFRDKSMMTPE